MSAGQPADAIESDAFDKEKEEKEKEDANGGDEDQGDEDGEGKKFFPFLGADDNVQSDASMEYASAKLPST